MRLLPATIDDAATLLYWRNDPLTRAMSLIKDEVRPDVHEAWLRKRLPEGGLFIGVYCDAPVGMIRFDRMAWAYNVSITLAPEARGNGLGEQLLDAGIEMMDGAVLYADIRYNNAASILIFLRCGFQPVSANNKFLKFRRMMA